MEENEIHHLEGPKYTIERVISVTLVFFCFVLFFCPYINYRTAKKQTIY